MKRIMIVDEDADQIYTAKTALENINEEFEVIGVSSAEQCLELLQNGIIPDLILSETKMSGMDGKEFSEKLKRNKLWEHIPMLFLTSWENRIEKNSEDSYNEIIEKPYDIMELKNRIDSVMKKE
jgi:CheY-like chemotaxis protein